MADVSSATTPLAHSAAAPHVSHQAESGLCRLLKHKFRGLECRGARGARIVGSRRLDPAVTSTSAFAPKAPVSP
eukprot:scaffold7381_cov310-Pinguiococcus_pyrenoidosus.AAC.127